MHELVIFDCDGVLVDSEPISNGVLARLLTAEGLPTTLAESRRDYQGLMLGEVIRAPKHGWGARFRRAGLPAMSASARRPFKRN